MACDLCSAWAPHLMFCCRHLKFFIYMYIFLTRGHAFSFCTGPHKSCSHLCLGVWVTQDAPPPSCSLLGRGWRPGICPQACLLCPASSSPVPGGPRGLCGCGRRALSWGKLGAYRGREQAGSQATAASLAVVSVVMRKLRLREVPWLVRGPSASKWWNRDSHLNLRSCTDHGLLRAGL